MAETMNERRDRIREEITSLISDRNGMLSQYCTLASSKEKGKHEIEDPELLQEFCENLIDYLARGQFELYQRISDGTERRQDIVRLANDIYPRIAQTTCIAVEFNDAYDACKDQLGNFDHYAERLSQLGEELAIRFELEDRLISSLLAPKKPFKQAVPA